MKRILSKKLVPAIVVSVISLQFIPFNVFAVSTLSSKTAITTTSSDSDLSGLAQSRISLLGEYSGSNPEKVDISFNTKDHKLKLYRSGAMVNSRFKDRTYITVKLFSSLGELKNSFTLKGGDYPRVNESTKKFDGQEFQVGDYFTIYHEEPQNNVRIFGEVSNKKSKEPHTGFSKQELDESIFKITGEGLTEVKKEVNTEFKASHWTNTNGIAITGYVETNFGKTDKEELIIKDLSEVTKATDIKIPLTTDNCGSNGFNVEIPSSTLEGLKPSTYDLNIGFNQNDKSYLQNLKYNPMKSKTIFDESSMQTEVILDEFCLNSSHCDHPYNKCRLSYKLIGDNGSVKLKVELKDCSCSHKCECLNK